MFSEHAQFSTYSLKDHKIVEILKYEMVDSTQNEAKKWLKSLEVDYRKEGQEPLMRSVVAKHQSHGRGRLDRSWQDQGGKALLMTLMVETSHQEPNNAYNSWTPLISAAIVCQAIDDLLKKHLPRKKGTEKQLSSQVRTAIKWPNDVLVGNKKISGILVEKPKADKNLFLIGQGINLLQNQNQLPTSQATSLKLVFDVNNINFNDEKTLVFSELEHLIYQGWAMFLERSKNMSAQDVITFFKFFIEDKMSELSSEICAEFPDGKNLKATISGLGQEGQLFVKDLQGRQHEIHSADIVHAHLR